MADPKKYFQLVNYDGQKALDIVFGDSSSSNDAWYYCDWDLDGNGHIKTIKQQEALVQGALKCIFTEKQDNGYGTNVYDFIGEKDVMVRRTSFFMDITMAMLVLKLFADEQADKQNLSDDDLIATMGKLIVTEEPNEPSVSKIQMSIITNAKEETTIGVL